MIARCSILALIIECVINKITFKMFVLFQRIERLWRDVWNVVTNIYYDLLHRLEEDRLLDPTNCTDLFCAQYVFLPRIQADLETFIEGWNNHSLRTERNYTPNQLWRLERLRIQSILLKVLWYDYTSLNSSNCFFEKKYMYIIDKINKACILKTS